VVANVAKTVCCALLAWAGAACDQGGVPSEGSSAVLDGPGGSAGAAVENRGTGGAAIENGGTGPAGCGLDKACEPDPSAANGGVGAAVENGGTGPAGCLLEKTCEPGSSTEQGTLVTTTLAPADQQDLDTLTDQLPGLSSLAGEALVDRHATSFADPGPGYDTGAAVGISTLQASSLALNEAELAELGARGFVISERHTFPSYVYGYETFYNLDLPLFVSADSILYAIHQSYDSLLRDLETTTLIPALGSLLGSMRTSFDRARAAGFSQQVLADVDFYLAVAASLLSGAAESPVAGANAAEIACLLEAVSSLQGCVRHEFLGVSRVFDFSQFTVRGHYTSSAALGRYFRAMMWLGRVDLRLIETQPDGSQRFNRRQLEAALALRELFDDASRAVWQKIDRTVEAFVGEHDSMTLVQLDSLLQDLGMSGPSDLAQVDDATIAQTIITGRYGTQRISSHIMVRNEYVQETLPLSSSFLLFGQRYVVDSHVFSNVVYDRVDVVGLPRRLLPNPLDVAFAALGNDQAAGLLLPELSRYGYAPHLAKMRVLVDAHPPSYWDGNLYNHWVDALRALSTASEARDPVAAGLPLVAASEAWGRRLMNTQLASWSELRHDTLLYAKQSYTTGFTLCEYPDAYVDPYPAFWAKIVAMAEHGQALVVDLGLPAGDRVGAYFARLRESATILQQMAARQRSGAPHDPAHIAFINQAVRTITGGGCGGGATAADAAGWYADLFYYAADRVVYDPNIADVHTQPTDEWGNPVGRILHVGTGMPRMMVLSAENCTGPHAYVGLVSSYFERITEDFKRLTDEEWSLELAAETPADVGWMSDLVVR
jgi:hypothetical protein